MSATRERKSRIVCRMTTSIRVAHGIWRPADTVAGLAARVTTLLTAACPSDSAVGGLTSARLHGLWLPAPTSDEKVEVIVHSDEPIPARRSHSRRPELLARRQRLHPGDVVILDGLPVTSIARTWVDLSARLSVPDLVAAGDSALRGSTTVSELNDAVRRARHCRGIVRARTALSLLDGRSRSRPESHLRVAIVSANLPAPEVNKAIYSELGEWLAEPDLSYEDVRLAIEYNGKDHAEVPRMRQDITRELDVDERGGWQMVVFGPREVFGRPDQIPLTVARLRRERSPQNRRSVAQAFS